MIETFVKRPAMTIVFVLVFVVLGIFSYFNLIVEQTPRIDLPMVSISVPYPGAGPVEIEAEILERVEEAVSEISQIENVYANAYESFGMIMIEFSLSADVNLKAIEVKDKVEQILNELPQNAERPIISRFDPLVRPILELVLVGESQDLRELRTYADKQIKPALTQVAGVASVDISGGRERQINVELDPNLMAKHFVTLSDITQAIGERNLNVPGGSFTKGTKELTVRFLGEFRSLEEIRKMPVRTAEGLTIQIGDVATVSDSYKKIDSVSRFNGNHAINLSVKKLSDGDSISIAESTKKAVQKINDGLPSGMNLILAYDSTEPIVKDTYDTINNIVAGVLLTVAILLVFLASFKVTLIASVVIPTSIVSTFLLMDFSNFTINSMSLLAMGTALGTLIANAIVIIESVMSELEDGKDPVNAAIDGTKKVTVAVFASAGTNLVVFTPIAFMGGIVGQFMMQFGLTVVYATLFSILASFTLTPMLCALILRPKAKGLNGEPVKEGIIERFIQKPIYAVLDFCVREYRIVFNFMFRFPKSTLALVFLLIASPAAIMPYIGFEFFPSSDQDVITFKLEMPQGVSLQETELAALKVEDIIKEVPETKNYITRVGEDGVENATVIMALHPKEQRDRSDKEIIEHITPAIAQIPEATITMATVAGPGGAQGDITLDVYGTDYNEMVRIANTLSDKMIGTGYFRAVELSHKEPKSEIVFKPNERMTQQYGVSNVALGTLIRTAVTGNDTAVYREGGEEFKINVTLSPQYKQSTEDVGSLFVRTNTGLLPLESLGEINTQDALPPLQRRAGQRIIQVSGYLAKGSAGDVQALLTNEFSEVEMPPGYRYQFSGSAESMAETVTEIAKAFLMAVILTYMLLTAILNSFVHPFTIVTAVFTSFVGVFYMMFFAGLTINIGSMMAFIMLVGLAVNNAILLLDVAMVDREKGIPIIDALWHGVEDRFRPIVMTSLAVIVGALPQLFDPSGAKGSMGGVIIGGMIGSMLFTFILIPLVYWYLERMISFTKRLFFGEPSPSVVHRISDSTMSGTEKISREASI